MPPVKRTKYLLTIVSTFPRWVEAFPATSEKASEVSRVLLEHIIPRFGLPTSIQSDSGPAFISPVTQQVIQTLGIRGVLHIPYGPVLGKGRQNEFQPQGSLH